MYFRLKWAGERSTMAAALLLSAGLMSACSSPAASSQSAIPDGSSARAPYASGFNSFQSPGSRWTALDPLAMKLGDNQTIGFGAGKRLIFTYQQQYDCVIQPNDDRNFNGIPADLDPTEMASPECQVDAPSTVDPTGGSVKNTDPLYVLLPFFETNKKTPAFTKALGVALKKLFGFVPDAFKPDPGVPVQCPAPKDKPGSCTMHTDTTDLGPLLTALGLEPKGTNLYVPLPDHDHLLTNKTVSQKQEWWQVIVVLVENPAAWPNESGTTGITSVAKLRAAQNKKQASADIPSNFFLFFSSKVAHDGMAGMRM